MAKRNFIPLVPSGTINADASVAQLEQDVLAMDSKVGELAEDIGDTEQEINQLKSQTNELNEAIGIYTGGYEQGIINPSNGANNDSYPTVRIRTPDYIPVVPNMKLLYVDSANEAVRFIMCAYDSSKAFVACIANNVYIGMSEPHTFDISSALTSYPTAKYIRFGYSLSPERVVNASEGNGIAHVVWDTLDTRIGEEITEIKANAGNILDTHGFFEKTVTATVNAWKLSSAGLAAGDAGYKLLKYAVTAGDVYRIISDHMFQFQSGSSVPSTGTSPRVGATYGAGTFLCKVPSGADYLIVSTPTTSAAHVYYVYDKMFGSEKGYLNIASGASPTIEIKSDGKIELTIPQRLVPSFPEYDPQSVLAWDTISTNISSNITIAGNSATITLPAYRVLVLNTTDWKLYIRRVTEVVAEDFVMLTNSSYNPQGWAVDYWVKANWIPGEKIVTRSFNAAYNNKDLDVVTKCTVYSHKLDELEDYENFYFFTDPHVMGTLWPLSEHMYTEQTVADLQKFYNSAPFEFCLCGGDWLDSNEDADVLHFKLGFVKGFMSSMFKNSYMLVGNHDVHPTGISASLPTRTMQNLWYNGDKTYFKIDGRTTTFYCFDTGAENQALTADSNAGYVQANWFANSLLTEAKAHSAICVHILRPSSQSETLQPLTSLLLDIAKAYNDRSSITINSQDTYNYTSATGKVEFLIAGHLHADDDTVINGIPCVLTSKARTSGGAPVADMVVVDYDNGKIHMVRAGSGEDREIDLAE